MQLNRYSWILGLASVAVAAQPGFAGKNRAVWFWAAPGSAYGSSHIVGDPAEETQTLDFFNHWGIKKVYGSYQSRPVSEPDAIAAWNARLDADGIESQFLMSENSWIYPANQASFLSKVTDRVIAFNNGRSAAEQFDGLHLDIEPQALAEWGSATDQEKRDLLNLLRDTYAAVRAHFVSNGLPEFPIYADLPVWFDNLGSIGWADAAERDAWFAAISTNLTGVSLMPFDRDSVSSIDSGAAWERANMTNALLRIGLESDIGASDTWATSFDFNAMMEALESHYGTDEAIDIQAYAIWRQALADEAFGSINAALQPAPGTRAADLVFDTELGTTYAVLHSLNLCNWEEIIRFRGLDSISTHVPVATTNLVGFYKAQKLIPLP